MKNRTTAIIAGLLLVAATSVAHAAPVEFFTNGDFETGTLAGWTPISTGSAFGFTINDGSFDPDGPGGAEAPIGGSFDAISSQIGPGSNTLMMQSIAMPIASILSATISWDDRIRNHASDFSDPNQEWRVFVTDAFAVDTEIFSTNPGDPLFSGPISRSFDITALMNTLLGQTIDVTFQQQDNLFFFNATLDNASLKMDVVPEPGSMILFGAGLIGLAARRRYCKKNA